MCGCAAVVPLILPLQSSIRLDKRHPEFRLRLTRYLRGLKALNTSPDAKHYQIALPAYTEALGLHPTYALALAQRSMVCVAMPSRSRLALDKACDLECPLLTF